MCSLGLGNEARKNKEGCNCLHFTRGWMCSRRSRSPSSRRHYGNTSKAMGEDYLGMRGDWMPTSGITASWQAEPSWAAF